MEQQQGGGSASSPAPFLLKTYEMVENSSTDSVVSWSHDGRSFIVWNPPEFCRDLLPQYFKHNNFSSFIRQLNTYGFRKIDPEQWEFGNEEFIRGKRHLLRNIHRRKPIHSHSAQNQVNSYPLAETERQEFQNEIQRLRHDKNLLEMKMQRNDQERREFQIRIQSLVDRAKAVEQRQGEMITFFARILKKTDLASTLSQLSEKYGKKRRLLQSSKFYGVVNLEDDGHWTMKKEIADDFSSTMFHWELIENLESTFNYWEHFLYTIDQEMGEAHHEGGIPRSCSPIAFHEMVESSGESGTKDESSSPVLCSSSPDSDVMHHSPEIVASTCNMDSPAISFNFSVDCQQKTSSIDVNMRPLSPPRGNVTANIPHPPGKNDVFWEQFLTETPIFCNSQEAESKRRDSHETYNSNKLSDPKSFWWNRNSVDNITKRMGHLSPAGRT